MNFKETLSPDVYLRFTIALRRYLTASEFRMFSELDKYSAKNHQHEVHVSVMQRTLIELAALRKSSNRRNMTVEEIVTTLARK